MTEQDAREPTEQVLGYANVELDVHSMIAAIRPGESLKLHPGDLRRRVPILAVDDDTWRRGIDP
ncbi:MAG: hypothetical protein ACT4OI_07980 [Methanobacteriota archaeon]